MFKSRRARRGSIDIAIVTISCRFDTRYKSAQSPEQLLYLITERHFGKRRTDSLYGREDTDWSAQRSDAVGRALESFGVMFIPENDRIGAGVRLKFLRRDVRQIDRLENEGGIVDDDDVP